MSAMPASTPAASTNPPVPRTFRSKWNGWYRASLLAAIAYATYILLIAAWLIRPTGEEPVPRTLNGIFLTGLFLATVMTFLLGRRLECRLREKTLDQRDALREAEFQAWQRAVLVAVRNLTPNRAEIIDSTTVDLRAAANGRTYGSASVAATGRLDTIDEKMTAVLGEVRQLVEKQSGRGAAGASRRRRPRNGMPEQRATGRVPIDEKLQAYLAGREDRRINGAGDGEAS